MEDPKKEPQSLSEEELEEIVGGRGYSRKEREEILKMAIEMRDKGYTIAEMNAAFRKRYK